MASIRKKGDSWEVQIFKLGERKSKTFTSKSAATVWAATTEADIIAGKTGAIPNKTFGDLLRKYREEVSPTKRGTRWEVVRINKYLADPLASVNLRDLNSSHFAAWRDRRMKEVGPGSVLREWNLLSNACKRARDEWGWMTSNPLKAVAKPKKPKARTKLPSEHEIASLIQVAGYRPDMPLKTASLRTMAAFLFSMESGLRAGEICALEWDEVLMPKRFLKVTGLKPGARKNDAAVRDVPLTTRAIQILEQVMLTHDEGTVFNVSPSSLDALFRKLKDRAGIDDLTYHDSRHAAITMLSKHYDVLALARIVGHTNIKELMTYYNPTIDDLTKRAP